MSRLLGHLARAGTAAAVFLLLLALLRFSPAYAEPPRMLEGLAGRYFAPLPRACGFW